MLIGLNEKAWAGLNIVIFGKTPLLPMQIEQSIAAASPAIELLVDSFEDYDQAFDFCKKQKNVGLILITENCGEASAEDTFRQLASHYESKGWPCFGLLMHEKAKSMMGYLALQKNKNLIAYRPVEDLTNPDRTFNTLSEIWRAFVSAFEASIIPEKLEETLLTLAQPPLNLESYNFRNRASTLLYSRLNVSWLEVLALKWHPVVSALEQVQSKALSANEALVQICKMADFEESVATISDAAKSKGSLCSRLSNILHIIEVARMNNQLEQILNQMAREAVPGSPALIRVVASCRDQILSFSKDHNKVEVAT